MAEQSNMADDAATWEKFAPNPVAAAAEQAHQTNDAAVADPDYTGPEIEREPDVAERLERLEKERD